jgi:hypothetical protein
MARPYINISNPSYDNGILSLDLWAFRLRGLDTDDRALTIVGFSQSLTQSNNTTALVGGTALGAFPDLAVISPVAHTFSVDLGMTANHGVDTVYTPASVTWVLSGTAFPGDSLDFELVSVGTPFSVTFSATASATQVVELIGASFSSAEGFEITTQGNAFTVLSPWGGFYNGLTSSLSLSASSLTATSSNVEFSGGLTTHNLSLSAPVYFGFDEKVSFQLSI